MSDRYLVSELFEREQNGKPLRLRHSASSPDTKKAVDFYVRRLGFEITDDNPNMTTWHGQHINLFIEPGPTLGPGLEVTVGHLTDAKRRLVEQGCEIIKDEPESPRCYIKDPFGLIYNLTRQDGIWSDFPSACTPPAWCRIASQLCCPRSTRWASASRLPLSPIHHRRRTKWRQGSDESSKSARQPSPLRSPDYGPPCTAL